MKIRFERWGEWEWKHVKHWDIANLKMIRCFAIYTPLFIFSVDY